MRTGQLIRALAEQSLVPQVENDAEAVAVAREAVDALVTRKARWPWGGAATRAKVADGVVRTVVDMGAYPQAAAGYLRLVGLPRTRCRTRLSPEANAARKVCVAPAKLSVCGARVRSATKSHLEVHFRAADGAVVPIACHLVAGSGSVALQKRARALANQAEGALQLLPLSNLSVRQLEMVKSFLEQLLVVRVLTHRDLQAAKQAATCFGLNTMNTMLRAEEQRRQ